MIFKDSGKSHLMNYSMFVIMLVLLLNTKLYAEIVRDGSLGQGPLNIDLHNQRFDIKPEYGQQVGNNLFHSFCIFNVNMGQTAAFLGGSQPIQNVLARVTGNGISNIDGTIRTEGIPNANLYLLNPNGFIFGPHAKLDVPGSFYASTAKGIKLGEQEFRTDRLDNPGLTLVSAPPSAFGFLSPTDPNRATIEIQGNVIKNNSVFHAPFGKINVTAENESLTIEDSILYAPGGEVNISAKDVTLKVSPSFSSSRPVEKTVQPDLSTVEMDIGNISAPGGQINITTKNGSLTMEDSTLQATGGQINLISAKDVTLKASPLFSRPVLKNVQPDGTIEKTDFGNISAPGGQIKITAQNGSLTMEDSTLQAPGGNINLISAKDITLKISPSPVNMDVKNDVGNIDIRGSGPAEGQIISIRAEGKFTVENAHIFADDNDSINIFSGKEMSLSNNTKVNVRSQSDNQKGSINLTSKTSLFIGLTPKEFEDISHNNPGKSEGDLMEKEDKFSRVYISNTGLATGGKITINTPVLRMSYGLVDTTVYNGGDEKASDIEVKADQVLLDRWGFISAGVDGDNAPGGKVGNVSITANDIISLSTYSTIGSSKYHSTVKVGDMGSVILETNQLLLNNKAAIAAFSYGSISGGGLINIKANTVLLTDDSQIVTEATQANGGNITLNVRDWLVLFNSKITAQALDNGGNLIMDKPNKILALSKSQLLASSNQSYAGNISLQGTKYRLGGTFKINELNREHESEEEIEKLKKDIEERDYNVIDASSKRGIAYYGKIDFNAQSWEFPGLLSLPGLKLLPSLNPNRCSISKENLSRFTITARDILPRCPEDLRTQTIRLGNYY